jgi:lipopolysaccharide transport system permease protein
VTGYLSNIWRLRHFWMALVRIDLRNRYRRSVIGMGWSLLQPIAMTIVLCIVFCQLFNMDLETLAPNLLSGLTFWGFIMAVVMQGCQCFFQGESYIRQHPAPLAIYPLRTTLGAGFHFLLGLGIVLVFVWWVHGFANLPVLWSLVPTLALLFVIGWSLAVCMGVANVMFQDCQHLTEILMQILFYMTPIIYPPDLLLKKLEPQHLEWLIDLNPFAVLLQLIRQPLLENQLPSWRIVGLSALVGLIAASAAILALKRFEKRMIFYL